MNEAAQTIDQGAKGVLNSAPLKPEKLGLIEETEFYLKIINKETGKKRTVDKFRRK